NGRNIQKRPGEKAWGVDPTDGYYIPLSRAQTDALLKDMTQRGLVGAKNGDQPRQPARLTAKMIEEQHADPQLGAALRTMVAKLTGGDFIKVGKHTAHTEPHRPRLAPMR